MVRPGRMYYDGSFEEWEEYLDKAAARARQQRGMWRGEAPGSAEEVVDVD